MSSSGLPSRGFFHCFIMVVIFPLFFLSPLIHRGFFEWTWSDASFVTPHFIFLYSLRFSPKGWHLCWPWKTSQLRFGTRHPGAKTFRHRRQLGSCVGCSLVLIAVSLVLQTPTGPASTWEPSSASNAQGSTATSARTCRGCAPWTWTIGPSSLSRSCQPLATSWPTVCGRRTAKATWSLPQTPPGGFWLVTLLLWHSVEKSFFISSLHAQEEPVSEWGVPEVEWPRYFSREGFLSSSAVFCSVGDGNLPPASCSIQIILSCAPLSRWATKFLPLGLSVCQ